MSKESDAIGEIARLIAPGGLSGWQFVEAAMERQIESGLSRASDYHDHFFESGLMESWTAYQDFVRAHPGEPVPEEINEIGRTRWPIYLWARKDDMRIRSPAGTPKVVSDAAARLVLRDPGLMMHAKESAAKHGVSMVRLPKWIQDEAWRAE